LKDSKILQIQATLPDPAKAAAVAQFIAAEVLNLSHKTGAGTDLEMERNADRHLIHWQDTYRKAIDAYTEFSGKWPVEALQGEIASMQDVASRTLRAAIEAEADSEDYAAREKSSGNSGDGNELRFLHQEAAARKARAGILRRQASELQTSLAAKGAELSKRTAQRSRLEAEAKMAQTGMDAEARHVREIRDAAGGRGEVLTVIDPGIVPQRPSSPNIVLNAIVCAFVALALSLFYLVFAFGRSNIHADGAFE
jgi:capsule polysaccharide export protein KpsE/RkpR